MRNPFDRVTSFFDPTGQVAPTYESLQQRKKIAAAIAARQNRLPTTIGGGLNAIGEALRERSDYNQILEDEAGLQGYERERTSGLDEPPAPVYTPYEPGRAPQPRPVVGPQASLQPQPDEEIIPAQSGASVAAAPQPAPPPRPYAQAAAENILGPNLQGNPQSFAQDRSIDTRTFPGNGAARADINPNAVQLGTNIGNQGQPTFQPGQQVAPWLMGQANAVDQMGGVPRPPGAPPGPRSEVAQPSFTGGANIPPMAGAAPQRPPGVQTAALSPTGTISDAPDLAGPAVARQQAGPQFAQAPSPFPNPNVASDAPKAILPGGGLTLPPPPPPPPPPPAPAQGPQIRKAPDAPIMKAPTPPKLLPMVDDYVRQQSAIANDPRISDTGRSMALKRLETYQGQIKAVNDRLMTEASDYRKTYQEQQLPGTIYANEKLKRDLEKEGGRPMTEEQRKAFGAQPGQAAWFDNANNPHFGALGTSIKVNSDNKAETKGDEETQKELAKHFVDTYKEGAAAAATLRSVTEGRALASKIDASPFTMAKQSLGKIGIPTAGLSEIQAFDAWVSRTIPTMRAPGSGPASDFDGGHFKNSIPTLMTTKEGKSLMFETMEEAAKNNLERSRIGGLVVAGKLTRAEGVDKMLELQEQAIALSDKVKTFLDATGKSPKADVVPSDDSMREWLRLNPNDPKAGQVRQLLGIQ